MRQVKPVCMPCKREMKVAKNGVSVLFNADFGPYEVHQADVWECDGCGATVANGWGNGPIAQHWQDDFADEAAKCDVVVQV